MRSYITNKLLFSDGSFSSKKHIKVRNDQNQKCFLICLLPMAAKTLKKQLAQCPQVLVYAFFWALCNLDLSPVTSLNRLSQIYNKLGIMVSYGLFAEAHSLSFSVLFLPGSMITFFVIQTNCFYFENQFGNEL